MANKILNCNKKYLHEDINNDDFFKTHNGITATHQEYNEHDYTVQIFSSTREETYAIHRNNIITNVRFMPGLELFGRRAKMDETNNHHGVYIVQKYHIHRRAGNYYKHIVEYLRTTYNLDLDTASIGDLRSVLNSYVDRSASSLQIRLISFVPNYELNKHQSVYLPDVDMVITRLDPNDEHNDMMHPCSSQCEFDRTKSLINTDRNIILLDIVNKESKYKPYYICVGNEIIKLTSTPNDTKSDGYRILTKTNGVITNTHSGGLDNLATVGVFETEEEAKYNGDQKLKLDKAKLEHEVFKLKNEKENMKMAREYDDKKIMLGLNKLHIEMIMTNTEHNLDMRLAEYRHETDVSKQTLDMANKVITFVMSIAKSLHK